MIVGFAGRIASGKSVVSKAVANHYSVDRVSFGDAVRLEARRRGLDGSRVALQDLGDELIGDGWDVFCSLVIRQADWHGDSMLIVDGLRHLGAVDALRRLASPSRLYLVFIDTASDRRKTWLADRGVMELEALGADRHHNEGEIDAVMHEADLVVANDVDLNKVVSRVIQSLDDVGGPTK
ncbi:MAG TPA: hypothetical protein VHT30_09695 [Acidimicrobiales bacterium]|jgi:dephospho-CoA kinase|nr:hypothetical protein [Acidimicrobiales bacterium]